MQVIWQMAACLFVFGFATSSMLLAFSLAKELSPHYVTGFIIGFINMMVMAIGIMFQHAISMLLDNLAGSHELTVQNFHSALILLPLCQLMAFFLLQSTSETYCK